MTTEGENRRKHPEGLEGKGICAVGWCCYSFLFFLGQKQDKIPVIACGEQLSVTTTGKTSDWPSHLRSQKPSALAGPCLCPPASYASPSAQHGIRP